MRCFGSLRVANGLPAIATMPLKSMLSQIQKLLAALRRMQDKHLLLGVPYRAVRNYIS